MGWSGDAATVQCDSSTSQGHTSVLCPQKIDEGALPHKYKKSSRNERIL